jgi:hypothetical protein
MPRALHGPAAALEREQLVVPERAEPLPRVRAGADLHPVAEADVVDDVDPGRRELAVGVVAVPPLAHRAQPAGRVPHAEAGSAGRARRRQHVLHAVRPLRPSGRREEVRRTQRHGRVALGGSRAALGTAPR